MDQSRFCKEIGANIKRARVNMEVSLSEIARRTGINKGQLWKVENGCNLTMSTLFEVCHAIDQQPWEMIPQVP